MTTTVLNTKISEFENKIPSVSGLVKKTNYEAKIKEIEGKYCTTADYNKFTSGIVDAKIKQKEVVNKSNIDKKLININKKITSNITKHMGYITHLTKNFEQISEKGYEFLLGRMYVTGNEGYQNFLVFAPMLSSLILDSNAKVTDWISLGISSEKIKPFDTGLEPTMSSLANGRANLKSNNSVLVQEYVSLLYSNFILSLYIVYELNTWPGILAGNFTLKHSLFGTVKLVRNPIKNKFTYNGLGIAFDGKGSWSFGNDFAKNVVIIGVDNNSLSHTDNRKDNFLVLDEGPTQGINNNTGAAEKN